MTSPKLCSLKRTEYQEVARSLPEIQPFDVQKINPVDVLIIAKGFEERALEVPRQLLKENSITNDTTILVGEYKTNKKDNDERFLELEEQLNKCKERVFYFDADNPSISVQKISDLLELLKDKKVKLGVTFDISGASSTFIFSVFSAIFKCGIPIDFTVTYAEANKYYPDTKIDNELELELRHSAKWASDTPREIGAGDAEYHELFKGHEIESRPNHIIGVPSLSIDRFERCIYHLGDESSSSPKDVLTLIMPFTEASDHNWRERVTEDLAKRIFSANQDPSQPIQLPNVVRCDTHQYKQIIGAIIKISDLHIGQNIYLVHFGTKMQTVGAALALLVRDEISLIFTRPRQFDAHRYSTGIGKIWTLNLGLPSELLTKLKCIGCLEVSWDEAVPDGRYTPSTD